MTEPQFDELVLCLTQSTRWQNIPEPVREKIFEIRSRPHTPASAPAQEKGCPACKNTSCDYCDLMERPLPKLEQHDAAIRKHERERLLNELEEMIKQKWEFMFGILPYNTEISKNSLFKMIESLRESGK